MAGSLKDQLVKKGLAPAPVDDRKERSRKYAEEADARMEETALPPPFEAPATGRIVERKDEPAPPRGEDGDE